MLDSKLKADLEEIKQKLTDIERDIDHIRRASCASFMTVIVIIGIFHINNICMTYIKINEIKDEIRELKNPAVSAEISVDKPTK